MSAWRSHGWSLELLLLLLLLLLLRPRAAPLGSLVWVLQKAPPVACFFVELRVFREDFLAIGCPVPCFSVHSACTLCFSRVL